MTANSQNFSYHGQQDGALQQHQTGVTVSIYHEEPPGPGETKWTIQPGTITVYFKI